MTNAKVGLFVKLHALPGKEEELSHFLKDSLPLANAEAGTLNWYAVQFDNATFGIFDTFPGSSERNTHLNGEIAKSLMQKATDLLMVPPKIEKIDLIAKKD